MPGNIFKILDLDSDKTFAFSSPTGTTGTFYAGGYYMFGASNDNFNPAIDLGTANVSYAAHFFVVQAVGGGLGTDTVIRISGTSITDKGVRAVTTEDLTIDDDGSAGDYYETDKKWIGQISNEKQSGPDLEMNYGFCKYWDNNNNDFTLIGIEVTGRAGANDATPNFSIIHHKGTGWTYNVGSTPTPPAAVADMNTDHNTEIQLVNTESFAWKRDNLAEPIRGDVDEGLIFEYVVNQNRSIEQANVIYRIRVQPN